ncbi:ABC transporter ATP-binding protein [Ralstonia sp. R-29]|uniref:ABC transporter ATP-binding protein n=1 Tax=Ralstonia sp. R-29 TaxID=3404059 RepID=UPI003CED2745
MIRVVDVHVVFEAGTVREKRAMNGMSLDIADGDFVTVIGSNGAGKSTLLCVLAGELSPTSGQVLFDNTDVSRQPAHERAALVARVFQDPLAGTCGALTLEENLALAARRGQRRGLKLALGRSSRHRYAEILEPIGLGLEARLKTNVCLLSGGQRQAASLLMASMSGSRLLLLDEHTAALDPRTAELVLSLTRKIVDGNKMTTLMVTHSMTQALEYGDRTVMLDAGRVVLDIAGPERAGTDVAGLLRLFTKASHRVLDEDRLLVA